MVEIKLKKGAKRIINVKGNEILFEKDKIEIFPEGGDVVKYVKSRYAGDFDIKEGIDSIYIDKNWKGLPTLEMSKLLVNSGRIKKSSNNREILEKEISKAIADGKFKIRVSTATKVSPASFEKMEAENVTLKGEVDELSEKVGVYEDQLLKMQKQINELAKRK